MKAFEEFLAEALDTETFQAQAKSVKGLTLKGGISGNSATYQFMALYAHMHLFLADVKKFAQQEGLALTPGNSVFIMKSDLCSIQVSQNYPDITLMLKLEAGATKNTDIKKALKLLTSLVKVLEGRVKVLKTYSKVVVGIQDICVKHKKAIGNVRIMAALDSNGDVTSLTVAPPKGFSGDVDDYFSDDFVKDLLKSRVVPDANKLGIKKVDVAASIAGTDIFDIRGLASLK
jgi:hypothetical protein